MLALYKFLMRPNSTCSSYEDSPNNVKWTRCSYPEWEVVIGAPDKVNIHCLMHDTRLCQLDVKNDK